MSNLKVVGYGVLAVGMVIGERGGFSVPPRLALCIPSGTEASVNAALAGAGASAILCRNALFMLNAPITFTAPNQQIYTEGLPTDGSRALLRINSSLLTNAIDGNNQSGVVVRNIQVDGNRPSLGYLEGKALIGMGGASSGQRIENISAFNTRSWTTIHLFEGAVVNNTPQCQGAVVQNSTIGPAGTADQWADGISLACGNSLVEGNLVQDATDGAIVIFGAPGSTIRNNTIVALTRTLLGGINMVDHSPVNGNYTGTKVIGNVIDGRSAFIKVAVAMGPQVWGCAPVSTVNYGGSVLNNTLKGKNIGYGFAVNGVANWTVSGNVDLSRHVGKVAAGCGGSPSQPAGFQHQAASVSSSTLQPEFRAATLTYVLGVSEPPILAVARTPSSCTVVNAHEGLYPDEAIYSCDGRFKLILQLDDNLVLYQGSTPLWSTSTVGKKSAVAIMQGDGNLVLYDATGSPLWSSGTPGHAGAFLWIQNDGNAVIYTPAMVPLWESKTCCR